MSKNLIDGMRNGSTAPKSDQMRGHSAHSMVDQRRDLDTPAHLWSIQRRPSGFAKIPLWPIGRRKSSEGTVGRAAPCRTPLANRGRAAPNCLRNRAHQPIVANRELVIK